jgi:hypothetical protein
MTAGFIIPCDTRWTTALRVLDHDVYDLPEYVALCARCEAADAVAFYASDGQRHCLIPLVVRPLPESLNAPSHWRDAMSPYGYSSALISPGAPAWAVESVSAFVNACREADIVSVFVRIHPVLPTPVIATGVGELVSHGRTVFMDLLPSEQEIRMQLRPNHRKTIARLQENSFKLEVDDWSSYDRFIEIYTQTMVRLGADPYYFFSNAYFADLRHDLNDHLHLISVLAPDGSVACGGLFTETNGIVQYHLGGTATEYLAHAPSKLMLYGAALWAKARGNRILHLGGGLGGNEDSLFAFKRGFSKHFGAFDTWRVVTDPEKYAVLLGSAVEESRSPGGFFPAYRWNVD